MKHKIVFLIPALILSGCASYLNTADNDSFSCPGMPQGVICKTPLAVYKSTMGAPAQTESDMPIGSHVKGVTFGDNAGNVASPDRANADDVGTTGLPGITGPGVGKPVRTAATVMRIWIAPWTDSKDDLHYPSYLFTEIQPRRWSFGKSELAGQGLAVPHREAAVAANAPPASPNKPSAPKKSGGEGQPASNGESGHVSPTAIPGIASPADINLD
ncbi:type IV conjugative transfer system lipoprotein TraV [Herbaspirillum huttiense]|uniref:type IV conjugative transfer system lipoprotein TraV n=1 Tax=Herbaspirillum huttiense TaxID=863372 RepID=UPI0039AEA570